MNQALSRCCCAFLTVLIASSLSAQAPTTQAPKTATPASPDAKELYVTEKAETHVVLSEDGSNDRSEDVVLRITSEAGVQQFSVVHIPYAKATDTIAVGHVRVRKPDGKLIESPLDAIDDLTTEITREAPEYSDFREKQIPVRGLAVGDLLELSYKQHSKPLIPGQFWYASNIDHTTIARSISLIVDAPASKKLLIYSPELKPSVQEQGGRRIYSWSYDVMQPRKQAAEPIPGAPDILLTTFQSWNEIGQWWKGLSAPGGEPNEEVAAKARSLTQSAKSDEEKARLIYDYVSSRFRYIGISFGIGRYQPHAAGDVFQNGYGDCKDKYEVLAAMLKAVGLKSYPALLNSASQIEPSIPSPGQFDHVIAVVPINGKDVWLDPTLQAAPFGELIFQERGRYALVMRDQASGLEKTPEKPAVPNRMDITVKGELSDQGTFKAHFDEVFDGDTAMIYRLAFKSTSQSKWQELAQNISGTLGYGGVVSNLNVTGVDDLEAPMRLSYDYLREHFSDWENHQITPPCPPTGLAIRDDPRETHRDDPKPKNYFLGAPAEQLCHATVKLPPGFDPGLPPHDLEVKNEIFEYSVRHNIKDSVWTIERRAQSKMAVLPAARWSDMIAAGRKVYDSEILELVLTDKNAGETPATDSSNPAGDASMDDMYALQNAQQVAASGQSDAAIAKINDVLKHSPKAMNAHVLLAGIYMSRQETQNAIMEAQMETDVNPNNINGYEFLARIYTFQNKFNDAREAWLKAVKNNPKSSDAWRYLGLLDMSHGDYKSAATEFKTAHDVVPNDANTTFYYGEALARTGEKEKGVGMMLESVGGRFDADRYNTLAYEMANDDFGLDKAEELALKAVAKAESDASNVNLKSVSSDDFRRVNTLQAYWDTLGWVYFKEGKLDDAERFLTPAWRLDPQEEIGAHLGALYQKQGKRLQAIATLKMAYASSGIRSMNAPHPALDLLKKLGAPTAFDKFQEEQLLQKLRSTTTPLITTTPESSEVYLLFSAEGEIDDIHLQAGGPAITSEQAKAKIKLTRFPAVKAPLDQDLKILRKGMLFCAGHGSKCQLVLMPVRIPSPPVQ